MDAALPLESAAMAPWRRWPLVATALLLAGLGLVPTASYLTHGELFPRWTSNLRQWSAWLVITALLALAIARLGGARLRDALSRGDALLLAPSPRRFALLAGVAVAALALAMGYAAFGWRPVSADELAQLWQARLLASGHLAARTPAHPEFFSTLMTVNVDGRWFTQFPVGGAGVLALGMLVGAPWLFNPLLTGLTAACLYAFVRAVDDERTARRASVLFALAPMVLFMGGSEMNHALVLAAATAALAALPRWSRAAAPTRARRWAVVIGVALGLAATSRPYDAVLIALPIAVFQLSVVRRRRALAWSLAWQCLLGALPVLLLLATNRATTGAPFLFGYDALNGPAHRPGFHVAPTMIAHTPLRGLRMVSSYLMTLDFALLAWPVPAVLLLVAALLLQRRASRWDCLLLAMLGTLLAGYGAYWAESYFAGPRFLYPAVPLFILLVARLPRLLDERLRGPTARTAAALLLPIWLVLAWALPPNRAHAYGVRTLLRLNREKATRGAAVAQRAHDLRLTNALVFVNDGWHERLAARLRRLGVPPIQAGVVSTFADACLVQTTLDDLAAHPDPAGERTHRALVAVALDTGAVELAGLRAADQVSLRPGTLSPTCANERSRADSHRVSLAELLPFMRVDRAGALAGDVIYARDFGPADELLRPEFGRRRWYVARVTQAQGGMEVQFEPYRAPDPLAATR